MNNFDADVIIAGAGPAGSMAAYELAVQGISVLILEKAGFPRYKVCGGGLTYKIIKEIPFNVMEVVETTIHTIQFSHAFDHVFSRTAEQPLMYCSMRENLDDLLLQQALKAGAKVEFLQQVIGVSDEGDGVLVTTKERSYRSRLIIGADGPSSIVARSFDLRKNIGQGLAWEAEIFTDPEILQRYRSTVFLDWGTFPGGYGWVFPKTDHFSIGVGGPASLSKQMMPYYDKFLEYLDFGGIQHPASLPRRQAGSIQHPASSNQHPVTQSLKSWPIPVRTKKGKFHSDKGLVAGDAAGLTDSLTGEGIYYAVVSGKMAARSCVGHLQGHAGSLESYSNQVNDILMTELLEGNKIKDIFNTVPLKIHCFVRDSDRAWRAFGKVLRGERSYKDVKLGFGKWSILWGIISIFAKYKSKWKEYIFLKRSSKLKNSDL